MADPLRAVQQPTNFPLKMQAFPGVRKRRFSASENTPPPLGFYGVFVCVCACARTRARRRARAHTRTCRRARTRAGACVRAYPCARTYYIILRNCDYALKLRVRKTELIRFCLVGAIYQYTKHKMKMALKFVDKRVLAMIKYESKSGDAATRGHSSVG